MIAGWTTSNRTNETAGQEGPNEDSSGSDGRCIMLNCSFVLMETQPPAFNLYLRISLDWHSIMLIIIVNPNWRTSMLFARLRWWGSYLWRYIPYSDHYWGMSHELVMQWIYIFWIYIFWSTWRFHTIIWEVILIFLIPALLSVCFKYCSLRPFWLSFSKKYFV